MRCLLADRANLTSINKVYHFVRHNSMGRSTSEWGAHVDNGARDNTQPDSESAWVLKEAFASHESKSLQELERPGWHPSPR
ncbi:MAG: hypothetical protein HW416_3361 [Chloroflexi bacterium]|nr:hypothetical protein [Chloroflexota bacterium]